MPNIIAIDTGLQRLGYCHLRKIGVIRKLQEYNIELDLSKELDDTIDAIAIALVTYEDLKSDINP